MRSLTEIAALVDGDFVGRKKEIDIFQDELDRLQQGQGPKNAILAIHGEKGIGKTRLVRTLEKRAQQQGALTAVVDLNPAQNHSRESGKPLLDQVILSCTQKLAGIGTEAMVVLWDGADSIPQPDLDRIQKEVLVPLLETKRGAAVVASRQPLKWPRFDLRRRLVEQELSLFSPQETERQLGGETDEDISALVQAVQGLTGGLPGANRFVVENLTGQPADVPEILKALVDDYLFQQQPDLKGEIIAVSPLPSFGYALLKRVLEVINPGTSEMWLEEVTAVAKQMEATGHVNWSPEKRGFRVNPGAAGIMTNFLKVSRPEQYRDILEIRT